MNGISGEAVRLLQARLAQFHYDSQFVKGSDQVALAFTQRLAGDTAGAKVTAEQARNTFERLSRDQPDNVYLATGLSQAYATMGEKDSALKEAEHAMMLLHRAKDAVFGPGLRRELGIHSDDLRREQSCDLNSHPIVTHTISRAALYDPAPITPALLRLDRSGIRCAPIPFFKNSARKSSPERINQSLREVRGSHPTGFPTALLRCLSAGSSSWRSRTRA